MVTSETNSDKRTCFNHDFSQLDSCQLTITSCVVIHDNNVSDIHHQGYSVFTHFFDNVTVTNAWSLLA